ncbi:MAG: N-acetylmuramoyl-L-alanine amidase [Verrucomicrobiales bacterium]
MTEFSGSSSTRRAALAAIASAAAAMWAPRAAIGETAQDQGGENSDEGEVQSGWEVVKVGGRDYITGESIKNFYRFSTVSISKNHVWFRSRTLHIKAQLGSTELFINNVKFVLSFPVTSRGNKPLISRLDLSKLIDPVLRPSYIGGSQQFDTVVLDAGHGGHDSGAKSAYGVEKKYALDLSIRTKAMLQSKGFKVHMTRVSDTFLSRTERVRVANAVPNSIFVSIHLNSTSNSTAKGIETYALAPQGSSSIYGARSSDGKKYRGNLRDSENIALATAVHSAVLYRLKLLDRGIKRARWDVLVGLNKPGILFESGFITSPDDMRYMKSADWRNKMADAICAGIINYRNALKG